MNHARERASKVLMTTRMCQHMQAHSREEEARAAHLEEGLEETDDCKCAAAGPADLPHALCHHAPPAGTLFISRCCVWSVLTMCCV